MLQAKFLPLMFTFAKEKTSRLFLWGLIFHYTVQSVAKEHRTVLHTRQLGVINLALIAQNETQKHTNDPCHLQKAHLPWITTSTMLWQRRKNLLCKERGKMGKAYTDKDYGTAHNTTYHTGWPKHIGLQSLSFENQQSPVYVVNCHFSRQHDWC